MGETEAPEVDLSTEARLGEPIGDTDSEVSAVEPAEAYFVDEETTSQEESVLPVVVFEAIEPADTYLVSEEIKTCVEEPEEILAIEADTALEAVINNSLDSAAGKAEHANGYWIEVSGDRDVLVQ